MGSILVTARVGLRPGYCSKIPYNNYAWKVLYLVCSSDVALAPIVKPAESKIKYRLVQVQWQLSSLVTFDLVHIRV
jgi:hypothetical protein